MMYQSKFVASLKVNGEILREDKDTVYLPFGSEYSIYMKNLEARKAVVSISVDGQDVLGGNQIILHPNEVLDLQGFMEDSDVKNRFRFIQKTEKIQEHRGDKIDDGLIRIEFQYEKPPITWTPYPLYYKSNCDYGLRSSGDFKLYANHVSTSYSVGESSYLGEDKMVKSCVIPTVDEGITVKGSETHQGFHVASVGSLEEEKHVIVLQLKGVVPETKVQVVKPVTVKTKKTCPTCGTVNKSSSKYCRDCGTFLG